jgi:hypothetical protein
MGNQFFFSAAIVHTSIFLTFYITYIIIIIIIIVSNNLQVTKESSMYSLKYLKNCRQPNPNCYRRTDLCKEEVSPQTRPTVLRHDPVSYESFLLT